MLPALLLTQIFQVGRASGIPHSCFKKSIYLILSTDIFIRAHMSKTLHSEYN